MDLWSEKSELHFHLRPRGWQGDASFISVCDQTLGSPEAFAETYVKLALNPASQPLHQ